MGTDAGYSYNYCRDHMEVKRAVIAHFVKRGIPRSRHGALWSRWIAQKGYRSPL